MKQKLLFLLTALMLLTTGNAWADRVLYSQDYESATDASSWVTQNLAPTLTTGDAIYGKYIQVGPAGGTTNSRSSYTVWGKSFYRYFTKYTLEFDANFTMTTGNTGNQSSSFAIMADGYSLPSANYAYNSDYIFKFNNVANSTTFSINEESAEYTMPSGVWCHYTIVVDGSARTATYTITNKSTSAQLATGTYNIPAGKSFKAVGMYYLCGRYNSIGKFDNISIKVTPISATLDHTAGAQWGSNTGESTVDADKEHYNQDQASAWAGCAYAKFSYTIPTGHVVTSATLTYSVNQGGNYGRDDIIYYMNKDFDLNWATFAGQTGMDLRNTGSRAGKAVAAAPTGGKGDRLNLSQDVTTAVQAICEAGQNYVIFQWTGNAGGADLYGKGADAAKRPTLVIETGPAVLVAIEDCKQHETSAAFAEAIDAQSFSTAEEVYAFHTAWQIENASSNEITKVIFDAQVSDFTRWNDARHNQDQQYTGAPDNKYFDAWNTEASDGKQKIYGLPAGTYTLKAATRASVEVADKSEHKIWVYGGSANASILGNHIGSTDGELGNGWSWTSLTFTLDAKADVEIGYYARPQTGLWAGCDDFHLYKGVSVILDATTGYATFGCPYPLNLTPENLADGVKAYKATSVDGENIQFVALEQSVPANTGILIAGEPGQVVNIPVAASASEVEGNLLKVNVTGETFDAESGCSYYGLLKGTKVFHPFAPATVAIPANKAYLRVENINPARLVISFDEEEDPTAINAIEASETKDGALKDGKYLIGNKIVLVKNGVKYGANGQKLN